MINIVNHGSVVLVSADAADHLPFADWLIENVEGEATFWGDALVCEPRYVEALAIGLQDYGFEVQGW